MIIDIVIGQLAEKGGLDKVINTVVLYGEGENYHFRIIQLVNTKLKWYSDTTEVVNLKNIEDNPTFRDSINDYALFLKNNAVPDVIVATGWPVVTLICRESLKIINEDIPVYCWPHMSFKEADSCGVGNLSCVDSADAVFCISKEIYDDVRRYNSHIGLELIHNPVEVERASVSSYNPSKMCYVGRLVDSKRLDLIFQAISLCKNPLQIIVVGTGEMEKSRLYAEEYGVAEKVDFVGYSEHPWDEVGDAGVFLMMSDYEGFGLTIVEAMARGLTVVSTPVGVAPEIIVPGKTGYLTELGSAEMLSQILDYISEGKLPLIPPENLEEVINLFSPREYVEKFLSLIDNHLKAERVEC